MTVTARIRGRDVRWDGEAYRWADTGDLAAGWGGMERPCPACGLTADSGEPDPCLGWLPDCESACCGHGSEGWIGRKSTGLTLLISGVRLADDGHEGEA